MSKMKEYKIAGEKVGSAFQTAILLRAFNEKELKSIWEAYKAARLTSGGAAKEPTDLQKKIAAYAKKTKLKYVVIAKEFNVTSNMVGNSIRKVAVYAYLNA